MASSWQANPEAPAPAIVRASRPDSEEPLLELRAVVDLARMVMTDAAVQRWMRTPNLVVKSQMSQSEPVMATSEL